MSRLISWWSSRPIFWQVFALVVAAVWLTALAMLALTFSGPPPRPAPTLIADIAQGLLSGRVQPGMGRPMAVTMAANAPQPAAGESRALWLEQMLTPMLSSDTGQQRQAGVVAYTSEDRPPDKLSMAREVRGTVTAGWRTGSGWRVVKTYKSAVETRWMATFVSAVVAVLGLILTCAWLVVRSIVRPLSALADGAESARVGQPWLAPAGPTTPEVTKLANALASFDARHREHVRQQTTMLAGIAHDLGTPLTRLAFRAESLGENQRVAANADIALMRGLIGSSLALARSSMARSELVDLRQVVESVVSSSWVESAPITLEVTVEAMIQGEPVALQRLVQNLVDNLQRHGGGGILRLQNQAEHLVLRVEDFGPGFPPHLLEQIGMPFVRGEPSRNAATGGNGLGLAIARTIAERHGGGLALGNRPEGGAWVEATLARWT